MGSPNPAAASCRGTAVASHVARPGTHVNPPPSVATVPYHGSRLSTFCHANHGLCSGGYRLHGHGHRSLVLPHAAGTRECHHLLVRREIGWRWLAPSSSRKTMPTHRLWHFLAQLPSMEIECIPGNGARNAYWYFLAQSLRFR
jgi:hypothetical protein